MAETFFIKRHDTLPLFSTLLTEKDNTNADVPVDLTNAVGIKFIMSSAFTPNSLVEGQCTVVGPPPAGRVQYAWQPGDTGAAGNYRAEVEVTFNDGTIITCPNTEYIVIQIIEDLG